LLGVERAHPRQRRLDPLHPVVIGEPLHREERHLDHERVHRRDLVADHTAVIGDQVGHRLPADRDVPVHLHVHADRRVHRLGPGLLVHHLGERPSRRGALHELAVDLVRALHVAEGRDRCCTDSRPGIDVRIDPHEIRRTPERREHLDARRLQRRALPARRDRVELRDHPPFLARHTLEHAGRGFHHGRLDERPVVLPIDLGRGHRPRNGDEHRRRCTHNSFHDEPFGTNVDQNIPGKVSKYRNDRNRTSGARERSSSFRTQHEQNRDAMLDQTHAKQRTAPGFPGPSQETLLFPIVWRAATRGRAPDPAHAELDRQISRTRSRRTRR
jgi:hypothetical protein